MKLAKQLGCALALGMSSLSMAAPVAFDFSEWRPFTAGSLQYVGSDGVSVVEVSPYAEYGTPYLGSSFLGLGIYTCTDDCFFDDNTPEIDGRGPAEAAVLNFGQMVNLVSATFSYVGSNDDFTLLAGGIGGDVVMDDQGLGNGFFATFNFGADVIGSEFAFLADHLSDDFKLYSVTADYVSNVPEPATLSLLGLGLVALGSVRRKKR